MATPFGDVGPGEVIGGYRVERLLGAGSTSQVFLGTQVRVGRRAAIKVLVSSLIDNKEVVARMLQEARVVNDIRHPNIVDIFDFVETGSPPRVALVMEYIEGPSVKALRDSRIALEQALGIALQLIGAVGAAHRAGVVHRDIKPDNLLLARDPRLDPRKVPALKVVDFGIAKLAGSGGKTMSGVMLGTPAYMAPEQVAGRPPASPATDVFAIGEVLYELLTGVRAYPAQAIHETVRVKLRGELPPLELPADLPGREVLRSLIVRCLAVRPQDRPSLQELRRTLLDVMPAGGSRPPWLEDTSLSGGAPPAPASAQRVPPAPARTEVSPALRILDADTVSGAPAPNADPSAAAPPAQNRALGAPPVMETVAAPLPAQNRALGGAVVEPETRAPPGHQAVETDVTDQYAATMILPPGDASEPATPAIGGLVPQEPHSSATAPGALDVPDGPRGRAEAAFAGDDSLGGTRLMHEAIREDESEPGSGAQTAVMTGIVGPGLLESPSLGDGATAPGSAGAAEVGGRVGAGTAAQDDRGRRMAGAAGGVGALTSGQDDRGRPIPGVPAAVGSRAAPAGRRPTTWSDETGALGGRSPITRPRTARVARGGRAGSARGRPFLTAGAVLLAGGATVLALTLVSVRPARVELTSSPPGAMVEALDTHERLGRTPLEVTLGNDQRVRRVRVSAEHYRATEVELTVAQPRARVELQRAD